MFKGIKIYGATPEQEKRIREGGLFSEENQEKAREEMNKNMRGEVSTLIETEAEKILDLFGSCTETYECLSAKDLVRQFDDGQFSSEGEVPFVSVKQFVAELVEIEAARNEMSLNARCHIDRPDEEHMAEVVAGDQMLKDVRQRLVDAGYLSKEKS